MKKKVVTESSKKAPFTNNVVIYQAKSGAIELRGDFGHETVWATQAQIAEVFEVERSVITKHIRNILKSGELEEGSVCAKFAQVQSEGDHVVTHEVEHYNLDLRTMNEYVEIFSVLRNWNRFQLSGNSG